MKKYRRKIIKINQNKKKRIILKSIQNLLIIKNQKFAKIKMITKMKIIKL